MTKAIYKYKLVRSAGIQHIEMPAGSVLLSVDSQFGYLRLWALVDTDEPLCRRKIHVRETGQELAKDETIGLFIGTVVLLSDYYVAHMFDGGEV